MRLGRSSLLHVEDFNGIKMFKKLIMFRSITETNYSALKSTNYNVKNNLSKTYSDLLIALQIMVSTLVTVAPT